LLFNIDRFNKGKGADKTNGNEDTNIKDEGENDLPF
jgi:hypothetical protein